MRMIGIILAILGGVSALVKMIIHGNLDLIWIAVCVVGIMLSAIPKKNDDRKS